MTKEIEAPGSPQGEGSLRALTPHSVPSSEVLLFPAELSLDVLELCILDFLPRLECLAMLQNFGAYAGAWIFATRPA